MNWFKTFVKCLYALIVVGSSCIASNPESVETLNGNVDNLKVAALSALVIGVTNYFKNRGVNL